MNATQRIIDNKASRVLLTASTKAMESYGLYARDRRRIVRHGITWCRSGCSLARALAEMDSLARSLFFNKTAILP